MELVNSVELPTAYHLAQEIFTSAEDGQIPDSVCAEIVSGIVVRWTTFSVIVNWIRLVGHEAGTLGGNLVYRLAVGVLNVGRDTVMEPMLQLRIQSIET